MKSKTQKNAKSTPAATVESVAAPVASSELTPTVIETNRPLDEIMSLVVGGRATSELSAAEFASVITEKMRGVAVGLREAAQLGYQASTEGKFEKVMAALESSGNFSSQTLAGLRQTVQRVIPFIADQGGDISKVGNLDGMRNLMPKVATLDKATGKFTVLPGQEAIVKRALAGESTRKLVAEIATGEPKSKGSGGLSFVAKASNLAQSVKTKKDVATFAGFAARCAAFLYYPLADLIADITADYEKASEQKLKREQDEEAEKTRKAEKLAADKAKKAAKAAKAKKPAAKKKTTKK